MLLVLSSSYVGGSSTSYSNELPPIWPSYAGCYEMPANEEPVISGYLVLVEHGRIKSTLGHRGES